MPNFKFTDVDSKAVENAAKNIDLDIQELVAINKMLTTSVMSELTPAWEGKAKTSFETQFNAYVTSFTAFVNEHKMLNDKLKAAGKTYGQADDAVKQLITKIVK